MNRLTLLAAPFLLGGCAGKPEWLDVSAGFGLLLVGLAFVAAAIDFMCDWLARRLQTRDKDTPCDPS